MVELHKPYDDQSLQSLLQSQTFDLELDSETQLTKRIYVRVLLISVWNDTKEVYVIFDDPGNLSNTPKQFEHLRRDQHLKDYSCRELSMDSQIPKNWRENILSCRHAYGYM